MALPPNQNGVTANLEAEFNGLLRVSKRLCMQALAWKLLGQERLEQQRSRLTASEGPGREKSGKATRRI